MIKLGEIQTIYDLVQYAKGKYGDQVFLRYEAEDKIQEKCFKEFIEAAEGISSWIHSQRQGLKYRGHVALLGVCSYEYLVAMIGSLISGGVTIPLDVQMSEGSLADHLVRSDAEILFYDEQFYEKVESIKERCPQVKHFICIQDREGMPSVMQLMAAYEGECFKSETKPEDCALMIFTSGTTGRSKGVMLSHANIIANLFCIPDEEALFHAVCLNVLPIHHIFSINTDVLRSFRFGSQLCICGELAKLMHAIKVFEPTVIHMVPMMAKMLYNKLMVTSQQHPELSMMEVKEEVLGKRLTRLGGGGSYLAESVSINFAKVGIEIAQGYGMSECSPIISTAAYDRLDKLASVGRIVEGCHVRIVDGEIQVKSPSVMMGYYKEPDKTTEVMTEDGWLKTGDLGYIDDEQFLYLTGRKKNLIILSNGENISPEGIENLFDADLLISDILVYGEGEVIAAEVYPNYEYAKMQQITDIEGEVEQIITRHNEDLASYAKIARFKLRQIPFEKTASKKIIRPIYKMNEQAEIGKEKGRQPENELQQSIYDVVAGIIGSTTFGIDEHLYRCGLDSLGSIMVIEEFKESLNKELTLDMLMQHDTILDLESLFLKEAVTNEVDYTIRDTYPLINMQKYFVYIMKENTTGNIPAAFKLDDSVNLEQMKKAIEEALDAHPALKGIIRYATCDVIRNDTRKVDIPIIHLTEAAWESTKPTLLVPYKYDGVEELFRIALYQTEQAKYMYFDMSHAMSDGMTYSIMMRDINRAYKGEKLQKETYTFFEYMLDEMHREQCGLRQKDIDKMAKQMHEARLSRSILTQKGQEECKEGVNGVIRKRLVNISRDKLLAFCRKHGVSENTVFIAALNYCTALFSDEKDVFCVSIYSGRIAGKLKEIAGVLFRQYFCRYQQEGHQSILEYLQTTSTQIINSMNSFTSAVRQGEMFFQFQGDILQVEELGAAKVEHIRLQLDSLPFHMQVMVDDEGYYMELRYWANRFSASLLEIFVACWQDVVNSMLEEEEVAKLSQHIQAEYYPQSLEIQVGTMNQEAGNELIHLDRDIKVEAYVLDGSNYFKKPYGAWGTLFIANYRPDDCIDEVANPYGEGTLYSTGQSARILPDDSIDFLENSGRVVLKDGVHGRQYFNLKKLEEVAQAHENIKEAKAYLSYDTAINEMTLRLDIILNKDIEEEEIRAYLEERCEAHLVPKYINKCIKR